MSVFFNVQNISCGYPGKFMLRNIGFNIEKGSFTGIIGPNGSGKTTLFKGISGELPVRSGNVRLNEMDLSGMGNKQRAQKLAIVSQHTESVDILVEDYVLMGRMPYKKHFQLFDTEADHEMAEKYMKLTHVLQYKDKLMSELSGGEQQLAAIARALTQEPDLLLLDEPTSHLDISHQVQILNLIKRLNHNMGLTVLMIIHDLNLAGEYCDYLIMLDDGKIHKQGESSDVLTYEHIEKVYKTVVVTRNNPISNKPVVFLVSEKMLNKTRDT